MLHTIISLFGGNLTAIIAALGGISGIITFAASPVLSLVYQAHWSERIKNNLTYVFSAIAAIVAMYFSHAFTGSLLDFGTWVSVWALLGSGITTWHDKFWSSRGTGISTAIESATSKKTTTVS